MTEQNESLFSCAHSALTFAFNYSGQQFDKSAMARLASSPSGPGKGLGGLDGAGQAGMIRNEVSQLGKIGEAVMIARTAPHANPCSCRAACCSGWHKNKEWVVAISVLADYMRSTALAGTTANGQARIACVARYFETKNRRSSLDEMSKDLGLNRNTIGAYASKVAKELKELEHSALCLIEDHLRDLGVVGSV